MWPWAGVGAQPGGVGLLALNWGEMGDVGAVHPSSPSLLGRLHLPPTVSGSVG